MRKILVYSMCLSLLVYFFMQESMILGYGDFSYQIPVLYPLCIIIWLFFWGVTLGLEWSSWEKYRIRSHMQYYQACAEEAGKKLDEARWVVCGIVQGKSLLRLALIAEDYQAMMSAQGEHLALMREGEEEIDFPSNRVIEQALKDEKRIQEAVQAEDSVSALHCLQSLPWDCWSNAQITDYILKLWTQWRDPVKIFLITKIAPMYWTVEHQNALLKTILADKNPERWSTLLKKYQWFDPNSTNMQMRQTFAGLIENSDL